MDKPKNGTNAARKTWLPPVAILLGVVAVGLVAWLVLGGDDDGDSNGGTTGAEVVSTETLGERAAERDTSIYWAGERQGTELELSEPDANRAYVRYLTDGAKAGDPRAEFLTVGTYASDDPVATLRRQANESDGVLSKAPGGATVYFDSRDPRSVYVAFPGVDAQIEVYDANFRRALELVNSGQIVPSD